MNAERLIELLKTPLGSPQKELTLFARHHDVLRFFASQVACEDLANVFRGAFPAWSEAAPLPSAIGAVAVPVTLDHKTSLPMAAEAAVLPVKWAVSSGNTSGGLPQSLSDCAQRVLEHSRRSLRLQEQYREMLNLNWTLQWSMSSWKDVDLTQLLLLPESAFAPLSAGLLAAVSRVALSRDFFCTGQWDEEHSRWFVNNQTLQRKLQKAVDLGYRRFVVPSRSKSTLENFLQLRELGTDVVQTKTLYDDADLDAALAGVLTIAGSPPRIDSPLDDRESWYDSIRDELSARAFYESHLMQDAVAVAKRHLASGSIDNWEPTTIVSIVSNSSELIKLATQTFHPENCVLIHTGGAISKQVLELTRWLEKQRSQATKPNCPRYEDPEKTEVPDNVDSLAQIVQLVSAIPRTIDPATGSSGVLLDVTPGKRTMTLAILQGAQKGDRILCWWHDTSAYNRRAKPLSVQPLIWEVRESGGLIPICPLSEAKPQLALGTIMDMN